MATTSAHLSVDELIAHLDAGRPDATPSGHLSTCDICRSELGAWSAIASGVRVAAPEVPPPPGVLSELLPRLDGPATSRWRLAGRRPLIPLTSAAAAAALVAAVGYGATLVRHANQAPDATATVMAARLTATECSRLQVGSGSLEGVSDHGLVLRTADGKQIPVTTTPSTRIVQQRTGSLADVRVGASVVVRGQSTAGTSPDAAIAAGTVVIAPWDVELPTPPGLGGGLDLARRMARPGTALGTVSATSGDGFTIRSAEGTAVRVTTGPSTVVITQVPATLDRLTPGPYTAVVGHLGDDGTFTASAVEQDLLTRGATPALPSDLPVPPRVTLPGGTGPGGTGPALPTPPALSGHVPAPAFSGLGCDAGAIAHRAVAGPGTS